MISENGTIKVSTKMDEEMQKELSRKPFILSLVLLCVSAVAFACFFVLFVISDDNDAVVFMIVFGIMLGAGIGMLIVLKNAQKAAKNSGKVNEYEFFSGYFTISATMNGETVATVKIYDNQVTKSRESKNYFFFYVNTMAAYPVDKRNLTEREINTIRNVFKLPVKGETVALSQEEASVRSETAEKPVAQEPTAESESDDLKKQNLPDPFGELNGGGKNQD